MLTYKQQVEELRVKFLNQIENTFQAQRENGIVIEFTNAFIIFQEVDARNLDYIKEMFVVERLEDGMTLIGKDASGDEWEENIYQMDNLVEVAHLLDLITDGHYKVIDENLNRYL